MRSLLPCSTDSTTKRRNAPSCGERLKSSLAIMRSSWARTSSGAGRLLVASSIVLGIPRSAPFGVIDWTIVPRSHFLARVVPAKCRHNTTSNPVVCGEYGAAAPAGNHHPRRPHAAGRALSAHGKIATLPARDGRPCRRSRSNEKREGSHAFQDIELDRRSGIGRDGEPGQRDSSRRHHARRQQQIHHAGRQPGAAQGRPVRQCRSQSVADDVVTGRIFLQRRRRQADRAQSARQRHGDRVASSRFRRSSPATRRKWRPI